MQVTPSIPQAHTTPNKIPSAISPTLVVIALASTTFLALQYYYASKNKTETRPLNNERETPFVPNHPPRSSEPLTSNPQGNKKPVYYYPSKNKKETRPLNNERETPFVPNHPPRSSEPLTSNPQGNKKPVYYYPSKNKKETRPLNNERETPFVPNHPPRSSEPLTSNPQGNKKPVYYYPSKNKKETRPLNNERETPFEPACPPRSSFKTPFNPQGDKPVSYSFAMFSPPPLNPFLWMNDLEPDDLTTNGIYLIGPSNTRDISHEIEPSIQPTEYQASSPTLQNLFKEIQQLSPFEARAHIDLNEENGLWISSPLDKKITLPHILSKMPKATFIKINLALPDATIYLKTLKSYPQFTSLALYTSNSDRSIVDLSFLQELPKLKQLALKNFTLTKDNLNTIFSLNLSHLSLISGFWDQDSSLTTCLQFFKRLPELKELKGISLMDHFNNCASNCFNPKELNDLSQAFSESLKSLTSLQYLNVQSCPLSLTFFPNSLKQLCLNFNKIPTSHFCNHLTHLYVTNLKEFNFENLYRQLKKMKSLSLLDLRGNIMTEEQLDKLQSLKNKSNIEVIRTDYGNLSTRKILFQTPYNKLKPVA